MIAFRPQIALPEVLISTLSMVHGLGLDVLQTSGVATSAAWPGANRALYCPLYIERPGIVTKLWTLNGAAAAGNIDIGLYDESYNRIAVMGSTAQAGTNIIQEFDVTDFAIVAATYFVGLVNSGTTGAFFRASASTLSQGLVGYTQEALGSTALPATATPAQPATAYLPVAGIAFRALVA